MNWKILKKKLSEIIKEEAEDKILKKSIESKPILFYNMILNEKSAFLEEANQEIKNPEIEPYRDDIFEGYLILIVILYLGDYEFNGKPVDDKITEDIFKKNIGEELKKKGFK